MLRKAEDYTLEEQLIARVAREFRQHEELMVNATTTCTRLGIALAKRLYAPRLCLSGPLGPWRAIFSSYRFSLSEEEPGELLEALVPPPDILGIMNAGRWVHFLGPAQIDRYGNINTSLIGNMHQPKVTFGGVMGLADNCVNNVRLYTVVRSHSPRIFVEKVDFVSGPGWGPQRRQGLIPYGAPALCFSNLGVLDFDPQTRVMRLQSVHTGVTVEQVKKNTGFELVLPGEVPETEAPTVEEVRLIREELDPLGLRRLDHLGGEEAERVRAEIRELARRGQRG